MTGFRLALGGAQELYGINPDLTTLGKIIGGGLPVGAYGGRNELMDMIALWVRCIRLARSPEIRWPWPRGWPQSGIFAHILRSMLIWKRPALNWPKVLSMWPERHGITLCVNRVGSMLTWFFQKGPVNDWDTASKSDTKAFAGFHNGMLERGIYLPPSQYEALFVGAAHTAGDIARTIEAAGHAWES